MSHENDNARDCARDLLALLEWWKSLGVESVPVGEAGLPPLQAPARRPATPPPSQRPSAPPAGRPANGSSSASLQERRNAPPMRQRSAPKPRQPIQQNTPIPEEKLPETNNLEELQGVIGDCKRCPLCNGRTKIVFGEGDPKAEVMFIGEGPGADEDRSGRPFVGRAGKLLTDIIEKGMGVPREKVYIGNIVKCRPPGNRNPETLEMQTCIPFLRQQIRLIQPKVLVLLGKIPTAALLNDFNVVKTPITRWRGEWRRYDSIPTMPTFHPSYLLRNPKAKREVWEDIKQVMDRLGWSHPGKK